MIHRGELGLIMTQNWLIKLVHACSFDVDLREYLSVVQPPTYDEIHQLMNFSL